MKHLTTFEDIFNQLLHDFQGNKVEVEIRQDELKITNFYTTIDKITINPLNKKSSRKWAANGEKIGIIILQPADGKNVINIPFILGFHTMNAVFMNNGVTIKTLNMEFILKRKSSRKKHPA